MDPPVKLMTVEPAEDVCYARADVTPASRWLPFAWHFVTAILAAFLGIAAFALSAWNVRGFHLGLDGDFTRLIAEILRHSQRSGLVYFCGFAFMMGLLPRSPQGFTGLLMVSPFILAFCMDTLRGTGDHNLAPFELLIYLVLVIAGTGFAMLGVLARAGVSRFLPARRA